MEKKQFARRMSQLRQAKGVSARDMSLSLGQSAGYINNIENGVNLPSMSTFFYICEYLGVMVGIEDTIKGFRMILDGEVDNLPEQAFLNVGTIEEAIEKGKKLLEQAKK